MREDECVRLDIPIKPLDHTDTSIPTQADGKSPLNVVGKTSFVATRGKIQFHWEGYVCKKLHSAILCGGSFMERNKVVQELANKRIVVDNKYYIQESSPFCPEPIPDTIISNANSKFQNNDKPNIHEETPPPKSQDPLSKIEIDPTVPKKLREKLMAIHKEHQQVFNGDLSSGYNGHSGDHLVDFNFINNIPPPVQHGCVPSYTSREDRVLMQAKIDQLEDQGVVSKANEVGIIPKFASPTLLVQKNSVREIGKENYLKLPIKEKLRYNRFVLCQNKLNDFVEKIPAMYTTVEDTIRNVGEHEFVITSDLTDSFWQRHIKEDKKPYFAFHSPFKGTYIFLRSSQGFLNQSEGLENLVNCVLQDFVQEGWVVVHADNIYVLGRDMTETIGRWRQVLDKFLQNNLKLSPKKTACFPSKLDLLGWTKQGKFLVPDPHRQNCLSKAELPRTAHDLRSYIGGYRRFFKAQEGMSANLKELEELVATTKTKFEQIQWTDELKLRFEQSKEKIKTLDKLYLPKPEDQLVLTSDWSKKGISATLWAIVDEKFLVVSRTSCKLEKSQENMLPCEGECSAVYVAAKCANFSGHIKASKLKTISLVDNKPVYQASNLLKRGKFSTSKLINELLTTISDLNIEFQHLSGKMGQNFIDDFGSRNAMECEDKKTCKVCSFLKDCEEMTVGPVLSFTVANMSVITNVDIRESRETNNLVNDIIRGAARVPFNNRQAMKYLQDQDPDLLKLRDYLLSAKRPQTKNTRENSVKKYLQKNNNITIAKDGCIVVIKQNRRFVKNELIVIPENISMGLLYGMHINLNHPTSYQLNRVMDTKFFILDKDRKIRKLVKDCTLCQSVAKIPTEIHQFQPNQIPNHPGKAFTIDILRFASKLIVVSTENFSGWISTQFIDSEKHDQLLEGIIQTVTPYKASSLSRIRVDQAPGFRKLFKQNSDLTDLGIDLELGEAKNKNALALVDRKMRELEDEIKKIAPSNNVINVRMLARATSVVNEKDVNKGNKCLSAKEILFSRDQFTGENLPIKDEDIVEETMENRIKNSEYSAKSKATIQREAKPADAKKGQIVFLKQDGSKLERRDMYLVLETDDTTQSLTICKLVNSLSNQSASLHPQNFSYKVKQTDVFLAPNQPIEMEPEYLQMEPYEESESFEFQTNFHQVPGTKANWREEREYFTDLISDSEDDIDPLDEEEDDTDDDPVCDEEEFGHNDEAGLEDYEYLEEGGEQNTDSNHSREGRQHQNDDETSNEDGHQADDENDSEDADDENDSEDADDENDNGESQQTEESETRDEVPIDPRIDQHRKPRRGDTIRAVINGYWRIITLTSHENKIWKDYYNCRLEDGTQDGLYLYQGGNYWTYQLSDTEEEDDEIDVERHENPPLVADKMITPDTSNNEGNKSPIQVEVQADLEYLDDNYSVQESIFGDSHIEYLSNSFSSGLQAARHEAFSASISNTIGNDTGRAFRLVQKLDLEIPISGDVVHDRVYIIPPHWRPTFHIPRSRVVSASMSEINEADSNPARPSAWSRRISRLRRFLDRVKKPFTRWR